MVRVSSSSAAACWLQNEATGRRDQAGGNGKGRDATADCCSGANGFVTILDTTTYSVQATVTLDGPSSTSIAMLPDGSKAYISISAAQPGGNRVAVLDTTTNTISSYIPVDTNPYGLVTNSTGTRVYVASTHFIDGGNGVVSIIDTATDSVLTVVTVGHTANMPAISADDSRVFVVNPGDDTISVIDTASNAVVATIPDVGNGPSSVPWGVAVATPQATTVTLNPAADTYLRRGSDNRNLGAGLLLRVRADGQNRAVVRFDQSAIQAAVGSRTLLSATLRLTIVDNGNNWGTSGRTVDAHRLLPSWAEGNGTETDRGTGAGATWNCAIDSNISNQAKDCAGVTAWEMDSPASARPWATTPTATVTIHNGQTGVVEYDVTADVVGFLNGTLSNNGWLVKKTAENSPGLVSFGSRESTDPPQLVLLCQPA